MELPAHPHRLVNALVPWLQADEPAKQRLLEIEPAGERLAYLATMVDALLAKTRVEALEHQRQKYDGLGAKN